MTYIMSTNSYLPFVSTSFMLVAHHIGAAWTLVLERNIMLQLIELAMVSVLVLDGAYLLDLLVALGVGHHNLLALASVVCAHHRDAEVAVDLLHVARVHILLRRSQVDSVLAVAIHPYLQLSLSTDHLIVVRHVSNLTEVWLPILVHQIDMALIDDLNVSALLHLSRHLHLLFVCHLVLVHGLALPLPNLVHHHLSRLTCFVA